MKLRIIQLACLVGVSPLALVGMRAAAPASKVSFADIRPGDSLEVNYSADGCFYWEAAEFIYYPRGLGEFAVTELVRADAPATGLERLRRGMVTLEPGEVAKLDRLLEHYRTPAKPDDIQLIGPPIPMLTLKHRRDGRVIAGEQLRARTPGPVEGALTFGEMLWALRKDARR